jgi:hypothetical protein
MELLPVAVADVSVIQETLLVAVHDKPAGAVTFIVPVPEPEAAKTAETEGSVAGEVKSMAKSALGL